MVVRIPLVRLSVWTGKGCRITPYVMLLLLVVAVVVVVMVVVIVLLRNFSIYLLIRFLCPSVCV